MLSVSLALICDYGVGSSWLCGSLSYLKGLIMFNPLDAPQPDLPAGGRLMPTEPNRQSINIAYKGVICFLLHLRNQSKITTMGKALKPAAANKESKEGA